jgi:hypothetical protein
VGQILMAEARLERRLAAILAADVAGYSRLMGADEEGTLARLKSHRRDLIDPKGRVSFLNQYYSFDPQNVIFLTVSTHAGHGQSHVQTYCPFILASSCSRMQQWNMNGRRRIAG